MVLPAPPTPHPLADSHHDVCRAVAQIWEAHAGMQVQHVLQLPLLLGASRDAAPPEHYALQKHRGIVPGVNVGSTACGVYFCNYYCSRLGCTDISTPHHLALRRRSNLGRRLRLWQRLRRGRWLCCGVQAARE